MNTIWSIILSSTFGIGLLISLSALLKRALSRIQKIYFLIGILSVLLILLDYIIFLNFTPSVIKSFPSTPLFFVFAPSLHLFIVASNTAQNDNENKRFINLSLLHFIPAIVLLINNLPNLQLFFSFETRFNGTPLLTINPYWIMALHTIQIGLYSIMSYKLLKQTQLKSYSLHYLQVSSIFLGIIAIVNGLTLVGFMLYPEYAIQLEYFLTFGFALCIYSLAWPCLNFPDFENQKKLITNPDEFKQLQEIYNQFLSLLEQHQIFKDPKLRQSDIAQHLNINRQQLSQSVNRLASRNFNDIVNRYRLQHILKEYQSNTNTPILSLALDAGFNSKATFNRAFRKEYGATPSEFLKKDKN